MKIKEIISKMSLNSKLAGGTIVLGFFALLIGNPSSNTTVKINEKDLAVMVEKGADNISVEELADRIVKGNIDFRLIDLRAEREYSEYAIPSSENIQIADLTDGNLQRNQKIILYSDTGVRSVQGWFFLKAKGFKYVYMLHGGLNEWKDKILFPKIAENATPEQKAEFDKMAEVSKFFGGSPQTGTTETAVANIPALPKIQMPAVVPSHGAKKKKREGC